MLRAKLAGVYIIEIGDWYYIGRSVDIYSRWQSHYTELVLGNHHSPELQDKFNEVGIIGLNFRVLEKVSLTEYKNVSGLKGKSLKTGFMRYLDIKERDIMSKWSANYALNKNKKYFCQ